MGVRMGIHDLYIGSLLEQLNLRFGVHEKEPPLPKQAYERDPDEGIDELVAMQKEFDIFKRSRPLVKSLQVLGVGGQWNATLKAKWLKLLEELDDYESTEAGVTGGKAIVNALIDHLAQQEPGPVHFQAHDSRDIKLGRRVLIQKPALGAFYIDRPHLTISLPMKPKPGLMPPANGAPPPPNEPVTKKARRKK